MATTRLFPLHQDIIGGVDTTSPAHLLSPTQWRTQHNFRLTPGLKQLPHKVLLATVNVSEPTTETIQWLGALAGPTSGFGQGLALTQLGLYDILTGTQYDNWRDDGRYKRWSTCMYNGTLYFISDHQPFKSYLNGVVTNISGTICGRYCCIWYDHAVIGNVHNPDNPNQVLISDLYNFTQWKPTWSKANLTLPNANESDYYEFVEWQRPDYPFVGVTGIGKLKGTLWVYTPTAIIPMSYVGLPKITQVHDEGVITLIGNTFPYTLACLDVVHFFYDAHEAMFFAHGGGEVIPIGDPVRQFMKDNLSTDLILASRMYNYIDAVNREVWWPFVSTASSGAFDLAVVFNYRYKKWFTASVENIHCFCEEANLASTIADL
jgi:hypothetical protein